MLRMPLECFKWEPQEGVYKDGTSGVMEKQGKLKTTTTEMTKALKNQNPNHNVGWPWPIDWPDELVVFNKHTGREVTFRQRPRGLEPREYFSLDDEFLIKIIFE